MPWWGWLIIAAIIVTPIKLKIMKKILNNNKKDNQNIEE